MVTGLTDIPEELIDNICLFLTAKDVSHLRLTCTNIRDKSYHAWATSTFWDMEFMITRTSLQHLIDFSKHEKFGPCIRKLRINTVAIAKNGLIAISAEPLQKWKPQRLPEPSSKPSEGELVGLEERERIKRSKRRAWNRLMHEQHTLRKQSIDVAMLVEAMRNLPNLEVIEVCHHHEGLDTWGSKEIRELIGMFPPLNPNQRFWWLNSASESHARVFATVLSAIATSGIKLRKFGTTTPVAMPSGLPLTPNDRSRSPIPRQTLSEAHIELLKLAFSQLKELHLNVEIWRDDPKQLSWVMRFFNLCPHLEDFRLDGDRGTAPFIDYISQLPPLPKLRVLTFYSANIHSNSVVQLLKNHANSLEKFSLCKTTIKNCSILDILRALQESPRLKFVDLTEILTVGRYGSTYRYRWYRPCTIQKPPLQLRAKNGQEMAEQLEVTIGWQLANLQDS
ncbi:hypothetical protein AOQ84DRAFT_351725 [Glonium stellatum]|uniref:F-box domain-containing protein n=1 Tax=Glonium stellatum TaxID=574774 RepID=A0A8E2FBL5_9PEZI|nr:hypothetical protein AOQ84DRAFT_351725 [Glonium stellatum]